MVNVDLGIWSKLTRVVIFLLLAAGLLGVALWYFPLIKQNERMRKRGPAPDGAAPVANYDAIWSSIYSNAGPGLSAYNIRMPAVAGQPAIVRELHAKLIAWRQRVEARIPVCNPDWER